MMRLAAYCLCGLLAVSSVVAPTTARADDDDDAAQDAIDYLALAARLLHDKHPDRAQAALQQVDLDKPTVDRQRFYTLSGLAALTQKKYAPAAKAFAAALKQKPPAGEVVAEGKAKKKAGPDPVLLMYLAQSYFGMEAYSDVLATLKRAGKSLDDEPATYLMRAQSNWKLKRPAQAIAALTEGGKRFDDKPEFLRTHVFYLVEMHLFQRGTELGMRYLARADATSEDYVAVAEALRRGKQPDKAGLLLEGAHLRFPRDASVMLALAHTYIDREQPLAAAMILEDASRVDSRYAIEAAELYKRAGRHTRALTLNAQVKDQAAKFRQRLAILIEQERFELVGGMDSTLDRLGLLEEDPVRYALAYALYKSGDYQGAERHLKRLTDGTLFESANQLRKAMAACKADGWQCT